MKLMIASQFLGRGKPTALVRGVSADSAGFPACTGGFEEMFFDMGISRNVSVRNGNG